MRALLVLLVSQLAFVTAAAQHFFNLTADEVRIDSLLPVFTYRQALGTHYADSVYQITIAYPEYIPMSQADIERYHNITSDPLPSEPEISQVVSVERKQGELIASLVPLAYRQGQYQKLVSFMLEVTSQRHCRRTNRHALGHLPRRPLDT